ncbi:hypothetical protein A2U01_0081588, partial [Trifolium medium]|nr:hypothetical protein [Trifolium medium]
SDQNRNQPRPNSSRPALATAATNESVESSQPAFSVTDLESLLRQLLPSGKTPAALSTTP